MLGQGKINVTIVVGFWYLWWERRKLVHDEQLQSTRQVAISFIALLSNYVAGALPRAAIKRGGLVPPRSGYVKLNIDADFDDGMLRGTTGAIICDKLRKFIADGEIAV